MKKKVRILFSKSIFKALLVTVSILCCALLQNCEKEGTDNTVDSSLIEKTFYEGILNSKNAFNQLRSQIETAAESNQLPSNLLDSLEVIAMEFPTSFAFKNVQRSSKNEVEVPNAEILAYGNYIEKFEPIFNAIEDIYQSGEIPGQLVSLVSEFEQITETSLNSDEEESYEKLRGRRTYCCCCGDRDIPASLGGVNCTRFRARKFWAKVRCKFLIPLGSLECFFGGMELYRAPRVGNCEDGYFEIGSTSSPLTGKNIRGFYRGSNNGYYYVRQIDNKIYWFGEDPNGSWANVMVGTLDGYQLKAEYFDVPKGKTTGRGNVNFTLSKDGNLITKTGGSGNGKTYRRNSLPHVLPNARPPGFSQNGNIRDLDGKWKGNDGGTYYIREINGKIAWFGEAPFSRKGRPNFANVAVGERKGNQVILTWVDVPKGNLNGAGVLTLQVTGANELKKLSGSGFGGSRWVRQ